jgi:pimeloyl-ACP methyl ester carboxylesterase
MTNGSPTIMIVHAAFAGAMSWRRVISRLHEAGHEAVVVQNPLDSFDRDVAATRRAISAHAGPLVLVGHGYGGAVASVAAHGMPHVRALVCISGLMAAEGEILGELFQAFGATPLARALHADSAGYLAIDRHRFRDVFAHDVDAAEARLMSVTQRPLFRGLSTQVVTHAAWRRVPSWYLVTLDDRAIHPELQRYMAQRMGATTREIAASHVPQVSQPAAVVSIIEEAVASVRAGTLPAQAAAQAPAQ